MQMKLMHLAGFEMAGIRNGPVKEQVSLLPGTADAVFSKHRAGGGLEDCGWIGLS